MEIKKFMINVKFLKNKKYVKLIFLQFHSMIINPVFYSVYNKKKLSVIMVKVFLNKFTIC